MGVGALCSSVLLASFGDRLPRINLMLGGVTLYGIIIVAFAASPWFELSLVLMGIVGIVHVTSHALAQTVIQTYSPSDFRGRTMAVFHMTHVVLLVGGIFIGAFSIARWSAVGSGLDEHRRRAGRDGHIFGHAACPADPIGRHVRPSRLASVDCPSVCATPCACLASWMRAPRFTGEA